MDAACDDIIAEACRGMLRHTRQFFPRCFARESITYEVDENLWPNNLILKHEFKGLGELQMFAG